MPDLELFERLPLFVESIPTLPPALVREVRLELERLQSVQGDLEQERRQQQQRLERLRPERDLLLASLLGTFHVSSEESLEAFCEQALELVARLARAEAGILLVRQPHPSGRQTERLFLRRCSEADEAFIRHQRYFPGGFLKDALERTGPELLDPGLQEPELRRLFEGRQVKRALVLPLPRPPGMAAPALLYLEHLSREDAFSADLPLLEAWALFVARRLGQLERQHHERSKADATLPFRSAISMHAALHLDPWSSLRGRSLSFARLLEQLEAWRIGRPRIPLLLNGESGTGRKAVAHALHLASAPPGAPFLVLDCGLEPPSRHEPLLLGSPDGIPSMLESAAGGTLLLHRVEQLSSAGQRALLHTLLERRTLGHRRGPAQLFASVTLPLRATKGELLDSLLHQLSAYEMTLPPLRARPEDICVLVQQFQEEARTGSAVVLFQAELLQLLERRPWPGNVRELKEVVFRLVRSAHAPLDGRVIELGVSALDPEPSSEPTLIGLDGSLPTWEEALEKTQRELLRAVMARTGGNVSKAARHLGISRQHLNNRLNALELEGLKRGSGEEDGG